LGKNVNENEARRQMRKKIWYRKNYDDSENFFADTREKE